MIPKRLIFIWLGKNDVPEYGYYAIKAFQDVNPDFEINFVCEHDIENTKNQDLQECIKLINSPTYNIYRHMVERKFAKQNFFGEKGQYVGLSDAFRFYMLNKYGGIYLDLDTFPVNKFDAKLLSYDGGFAVSHVQNKCDIFFLGFQKSCVDDGLIRVNENRLGEFFDFKYSHKYNDKVHKIIYYEKLIRNSKRYKTNNQKLLEMKLQYGESVLYRNFLNEYYIDHFRIGAWR